MIKVERLIKQFEGDGKYPANLKNINKFFDIFNSMQAISYGEHDYVDNMDKLFKFRVGKFKNESNEYLILFGVSSRFCVYSYQDGEVFCNPRDTYICGSSGEKKILG